MLVVGDLMLDRYVSGPETRISPESPVPVVQVEKEWAGVGGAANVAANVVALGAQCDVVGCVGDDDAGWELRERLDALGVGIAGVVETGEQPTTVKTRILAGHQQVVRIDREDSDDVSPEAVRLLREEGRRGLAGCASVMLQDYDKGVLVLPRSSRRSSPVPGRKEPPRSSIRSVGDSSDTARPPCSSRMRRNWRMPLESLFVLRMAFGWRKHARGWTANLFS